MWWTENATRQTVASTNLLKINNIQSIVRLARPSNEGRMAVAKRKQAHHDDVGRKGTMTTRTSMKEVVAALQPIRNERVDSANSCRSTASCLTSERTPSPQAFPPTCRADPPALIDVPARPRVTTSCEVPGSSSPSGSDDGGPKRRGVRFADECGSELVTKVSQTTYWWDDMVCGVDKCPTCGHVATSEAVDSGANNTSDRNSGGESMDSSICQRCGAPHRTLPPGDLFLFIEELSEGVQATLLEPALIGKKKTNVLIYTEDRGESICWLEVGTRRACQPYCVPCNALLEVKDCKGLAAKKTRGVRSVSSRSQGPLPSAPARAKIGTVSLAAHFQGSHVQAAESTDKNIASTGAPLPGEGVSSGLSEGGGDRTIGGRRDVRIKLRWRLNPTSSLKKVTIVDVRCSNLSVFARGMVQLQEHNTDLLV